MGRDILGDACSIAVAYAFESVLNAVGDDGLMSDFKAVVDFPRVCGADGVLICRDNFGLLGGDECRGGNIAMEEHS